MLHTISHKETQWKDSFQFLQASRPPAEANIIPYRKREGVDNLHSLTMDNLAEVICILMTAKFMCAA